VILGRANELAARTAVGKAARDRATLLEPVDELPKAGSVPPQHRRAAELDGEAEERELVWLFGRDLQSTHYRVVWSAESDLEAGGVSHEPQSGAALLGRRRLEGVVLDGRGLARERAAGSLGCSLPATRRDPPLVPHSAETAPPSHSQRSIGS